MVLHTSHGVNTISQLQHQQSTGFRLLFPALEQQEKVKSKTFKTVKKMLAVKQSLKGLSEDILMFANSLLKSPTLKLCSQLARVRVKPRVCAYFCWLLGRHAYGNAPKWNFQHVGIFSAYQARISVHASHFDWRGQKISTRRCRTR